MRQSHFHCSSANTEFQLRIYTIGAGRMTEFIEGWRTNIVASRERFGFKVVAAWTNIDIDEFVWVLSWDGLEGFVAADLAYYESPGRKSLQWDPVPFITADQLRILHQVPF